MTRHSRRSSLHGWRLRLISGFGAVPQEKQQTKSRVHPGAQGVEKRSGPFQPSTEHQPHPKMGPRKRFLSWGRDSRPNRSRNSGAFSVILS